MSDLSSKDRKKSAHWTEADTAILVNCLMRHKDTGRTQDNGFKPEVWKEAADLVKGSTMMGGPKTPDACKSRWQRVRLAFLPVLLFTPSQHSSLALIRIAATRLQGRQGIRNPAGLCVGPNQAQT